MPKKQLALDANILFDLAGAKNFAHSLRENLQERNYSLRVPPTVVQELTYFALEKKCAETFLALSALQKMRSWNILPFDLRPTEHGIAEQFSRKLIKKGFLPETEFNDGLILAETPLAGIPILTTSDHHLLGIDDTMLRIQFEDSDLPRVFVVSPRNLLKALCF